MATVTNLGYLAITFKSAQPEADESMAFSQFTTLEKSTAGFYTTFAITAHDRYRNVQTSDGFFFTVQLIHQRTGRRILTNSIYQPSGRKRQCILRDVTVRACVRAERVPSFQMIRSCFRCD